MKTEPNYAETISGDGRVNYWSVYEQRWTSAWAHRIPARDMAAMGREDREAAIEAREASLAAEEAGHE